MGYTGGSYRIRQGWHNAPLLTSNYEVIRFPRQADQGYTRWVIPVDESGVYDRYQDVSKAFSGKGYAEGSASFNWIMSGLSSGMAAYLIDTLFSGNASEKFTVMTWDRTRNDWRTVWCWGVLQNASSAGEHGYKKGFRRYRIEFEVIQDAPAGPDLLPVMTYSPPVIQNNDEIFTITVQNQGDGAALNTITVTHMLDPDWTFVEASATGWTLEYYESGAWVSTVTTPGDVTAIRGTYDTALDAGATSSAIVLTLTPTATGAFDLVITVSTSDDTDPSKDTLTEEVTVTA